MSYDRTPQEEANSPIKPTEEALKAFEERAAQARTAGEPERRPQEPPRKPGTEIVIAAPGYEPKPGWRVGLVWQGDRPGRLVAHNKPMKVVKIAPNGKIVLKPMKAELGANKK